MTTPNSALYVDPSTGALSTGAVQFRNRIINGDMRIDQRLAGVANASLATGFDTYTADRWAAWRNTAGNFSVQRVATATAPGNIYALQATVTTATSPVSTDSYFLHQKIEGYNVADFGLGASSATPFTVSFWVRSSIAGTYSFICQNSAKNRSYVTTYVINAANTWEYKTITIQGDTTGTWLANNSTGLDCIWGLGFGPTAGTATGNTWSTSSMFGLTGTTQWINNAAATFAITNVQVEKGMMATPFEVRPYGMELQMCMRYYEKSYNLSVTIGSITEEGVLMGRSINTSGRITGMIQGIVEKRSLPLMTWYNPATGTSASIRNSTLSTNVSVIAVTEVGTKSIGTPTITAAAADGYLFKGHWVADSEL